MSPKIGDYVSTFDDHNKIVAGLVEGVDGTSKTAMVRLSDSTVREVPFSAVHPLGVQSCAAAAAQQASAAANSSKAANNASHHNLGGHIVVGEEQSNTAPDTTPEKSLYQHGLVAGFLWQLVAPLSALLHCSGPGGPLFNLGFIIMFVLSDLCRKNPDEVSEFACLALKSVPASSSAALAPLDTTTQYVHTLFSLPRRGVLTAMCEERARSRRPSKTKQAFEKPHLQKLAKPKKSKKLDELSRRFSDTMGSVIYVMMFCLLLSVPSGNRLNLRDENALADIEHVLLLRDCEEEDVAREGNEKVVDGAPQQESTRSSHELLHRHRDLVESVFSCDVKLSAFVIEQKGFLIMHGVIIAVTCVLRHFVTFVGGEAGGSIRVAYRSEQARVVFSPAEEHLLKLHDLMSPLPTLEVWLLSSICINSILAMIGYFFKKKK